MDQKSGVYVADVETGNVETVKGKTKLLLDPRKQKHVERIVPGYNWNLMIGHVEPHKKVRDSSSVTTPWAVSVRVPNNEAVLITSRDGRRPIIENDKGEFVVVVYTIDQPRNARVKEG